MGGDQCQNLQLFLSSTKIICMVKFYTQTFSHLHREVLHKMRDKSSIHTNDALSIAW